MFFPPLRQNSSHTRQSTKPPAVNGRKGRQQGALELNLARPGGGVDIITVQKKQNKLCHHGGAEPDQHPVEGCILFPALCRALF